MFFIYKFFKIIKLIKIFSHFHSSFLGISPGCQCIKLLGFLLMSKLKGTRKEEEGEVGGRGKDRKIKRKRYNKLCEAILNYDVNKSSDILF